MALGFLRKHPPGVSATPSSPIVLESALTMRSDLVDPSTPWDLGHLITTTFLQVVEYALSSGVTLLRTDPAWMPLVGSQIGAS